MSRYHLEKWVWTEQDYDEMGWHDTHVHAMAFQLDEWDIGFDIDYILEWINPEPPEQYFTFWIAPATLVFHNVTDIKLPTLDVSGLISLQGIERMDERKVSTGMKSWLWRLDGNEGWIEFEATGYTQYFRRKPLLQRVQALSFKKRGGISFAKGKDLD